MTRYVWTEDSIGMNYRERIQTLQDQIQSLSEQNRTQAEELNLWKISTMGETEDCSSPSITTREFQIFLPCNSIKPCTQQTRTTDVTHQCGLEGWNELIETQMTHIGSESLEPAEGLVMKNEKQMITENTQQCASSSVNHSDGTQPVCTSDKTTKDGLSDPQQIALMSPVYQSNTTGAGANRQEDALINISISSEYQNKVIKPITESREDQRDSQNSDSRTARNQIETTETLVLDKHWYKRYGRHAAEVGSASHTSVSSKGQRSENREAYSVSTQTEESGEMSVTTMKRSLFHISTQTDDVHLETEEGEEPAGSPPVSPTLPSVANQLLLSKAFPMSDPAHLAQRIRQNRNRMSAAYDDTEYEPYGLPEVVMKGFADIPSGPACPYVLRRGLLGTDAMPLPLKEATPQDENEEIEP